MKSWAYIFHVLVGRMLMNRLFHRALNISVRERMMTVLYTFQLRKRSESLSERTYV